MKKNKMQKLLLIGLVSLLIFSCDKDKTYDKTKAISAFDAIEKIKISEELKNVEVKVPAQSNIDFSSGNAALQNNKSENFTFNFQSQEKGFFKKRKEIKLNFSSQFWSIYFGDEIDNFVFSPVIKDSAAFFIDSAGVAYSFDLEKEKLIWKKRIFAKKFLQNYRAAKIGYGVNEVLVVIDGINKIAALNAKNGEILWEKTLSAIAIANPIIDEKFTYILTDTNKLYALDITSGDIAWTHFGVLENTAIFGSSSPVIYGDFLIVSYSSGEIYALNKNNGETIWSEELNTNKAISSNYYLNDIDATPIVKNNIVYAIGNGGSLAALDISNGNFIWRKKIAGIVDFWIAGEFLFIIENENRLLAVSKKTGAIKWISALPDYAKKKKPQTKYIYSGLVMAGDKLIISRQDGEILIVSPFDGRLEKSFNIGRRIFHAPIVINGKIYLNAIGSWSSALIEIQ